MATKIKKNCKVCGAEYDVCLSCEKNHSWKVHTDTEDHYYVFLALMEYRVCQDAQKAYETIMKRGIDFQNLDGYVSDVRGLLEEIFTRVQGTVDETVYKDDFTDSESMEIGEN